MSILHVPRTSANRAEWERVSSGAINQLISRVLAVDSFTSAATLDYKNDIALVDATAAAVTITLPKAQEYKGRPFYIKKVDASANAVTVEGDGSETIDGAANVSLASQWDGVRVVSDGTGWVTA
jgi:hypothetical protein